MENTHDDGPILLPGRGDYTGNDAVPSVPLCDYCHTDEFLLIEEFVPARLLLDRGQLRPAEASYSCTRCGAFSGHAVPSQWVPSGWTTSRS